MALILQSCKIWLQSAGFAWHWQSWKFFAGSVWILVMSTFCWNILQWSQARNALTVFHSYPEFRCLIPRCRYQLLSCRRVVWFSGRARLHDIRQKCWQGADMRTCENIRKKQKLSLPTFTVKMQEMEKQETPPHKAKRQGTGTLPLILVVDAKTWATFGPFALRSTQL